MESDESRLIRPRDFLNISSTEMFPRDLFRFDWFVCSMNMPFRFATEQVGKAYEEEMYLENYLNCLLSKIGLNSTRRSGNASAGFTTGISIVI